MMWTWKDPTGENGDEVLFTCQCHDTLCQLRVMEFYGEISFSITPRSNCGFFSRLASAWRLSRGGFNDVILSTGDARVLSDVLLKAAKDAEASDEAKREKK